jgi:outer membrane protein, multidrug efflux system
MNCKLKIANCKLQIGAGLMLCAATLASAQTTTAPVVTLSEARQRALAVDPNSVAASQRIRVAGWERRAATADLYAPRLNGSINYIRFSEPFFNFGTGSVSPNAAAASLEASYVILGAGKLGTLKSSRAALESAEANETATRFQSALFTDAAYFGVLAARELSRVAADRVKRAEEQLAIARVRVVAGEAIASDSLQLVLELNRARFALLRQDSAVVASRFQLGSLIGLPGPADAAPFDTTTLPDLPFSEEQAIAELRQRGPDVEAARAEEKRAESVLGAERERYLPALTLSATTGAYDSELFPNALKRSQLQLAMVLPFWDGGQRELAVARLQADRNVARARREERERSAGERIVQSYHGYRTARAGIALALVGVTAASETYRVQRARYGEGATTILELLEAQIALSEAEAALVQARFGARLALSQIETLLGRRVFESGDRTNR